MPNFYLAPLHISDDTAKGGEYARVPPLFYYPDYNPTGVLTGRWSLQDFGGKNNYCILTTEDPIPAPLLTREFYAFPDDLFKAPEVNEKDAIFGFLRDQNIEGAWVKEGESHREILHRLFGVSQSMQSAEDDPFTVPEKQDPSRWLIKPVRCGFVEVAAYDQRGFQAEEFERQAFLRKQREKIFPYPVSWERGSPHWVMPDGRLIPVIMGGTSLVTDDFTTASDQAISTYNANWAINVGGYTVRAATDDFIQTGGSANGAFRSDISAPNDQYAQITVSALGAGTHIGAGARCGAAGVASHYFARERTGDSSYGKRVTGTFTSFGSSTGGAVSDTLYIEAQGTTILWKRNGSTVASTTDSSLSSGSVGIAGFGNDTDSAGDNFEGGDFLAGGGASLLVDDRSIRFQNILMR